VALDAEARLRDGDDARPARWVALRGMLARPGAGSSAGEECPARVSDVFVDTSAFGAPLPLHTLLGMLAERLNAPLDATGYDAGDAADRGAEDQGADDARDHVLAVASALRGEARGEDADADVEAPAPPRPALLAPLLEDPVAAQALAALAGCPSLCAALPAHVRVARGGRVEVDVEVDAVAAGPDARALAAHLTRLLRPAHALPDDLVLRVAAADAAVAVPLGTLRSLRALALPFLALPPRLDIVDFLYREHFRSAAPLPALAAAAAGPVASACGCDCGCGVPAARGGLAGSSHPAADAAPPTLGGASWPPGSSAVLKAAEDAGPASSSPPGVAVVPAGPPEAAAAAAALLPLLNQAVAAAARGCLSEAERASSNAPAAPPLAAQAAAVLDQLLPPLREGADAHDADDAAAEAEAYATVRAWLLRRLAGSTLTSGCWRCLPSHLAHVLRADALRLLAADGIGLLRDLFHDSRTSTRRDGAPAPDPAGDSLPHTRATVLRIAAALSAPARLAGPSPAADAADARAQEVHAQVAAGLASLAEALAIAHVLASTDADADADAARAAVDSSVARWRRSCASRGCPAAPPLAPSSPQLLALLAALADSPAAAFPMLVDALGALPTQQLRSLFFSPANFPFLAPPVLRVRVALPKPLLSAYQLRHSLILSVQPRAIRSLPAHWAPSASPPAPPLVRGHETRGARGTDARGARATESRAAPGGKPEGKKGRKTGPLPAPSAALAAPLLDVLAVALPVAPAAHALVVRGGSLRDGPLLDVDPVSPGPAAAPAPPPSSRPHRGPASALPQPVLPAVRPRTRARPSAAMGAVSRVFLLPASSRALFAHLARGNTLPLLCVVARLAPHAYYSQERLAAHAHAAADPDHPDAAAAFPEAATPAPCFALAALDLAALTLPGVADVTATVPLRAASAADAVDALTRAAGWKQPAQPLHGRHHPLQLDAPALAPEPRLALDLDFPAVFAAPQRDSRELPPPPTKAVPTPAPAPAPSPGPRSRLGKGRAPPEPVAEASAEPETVDAARSEVVVRVACDRDWFAAVMAGCTEGSCSCPADDCPTGDEQSLAPLAAPPANGCPAAGSPLDALLAGVDGA
jgi:hypothetical protein